MFYKQETLDNEIRNIKAKYCVKCIYFDKGCTKNKIYKKCLRNNERVMKMKVGEIENDKNDKSRNATEN